MDILTQDTDTGAAATTVSTTADASGAYSAPVAIGFGTNVITVAATTAAGATGYAQTSVIGDVSGGTTVLSVTDPTGDDNGPGTYQYPTSSSYSAGSWDLTGFQVITAGSEVYLRTSLANLVPTFGSVDGAQLLDIYVHDPSATATSTAAAFPTRNYTIAPADAWSERLEVQGFASPVWVNASGGQVGTPTAVVASTVADTITIALPEAEFGTPAAGWTFTVAITGQNGFNADQAISFTTNPGAFTLGVCPVGGTERDLLGQPEPGARGDGHHHTARRLAGHRAQPGPRAGRPAGGHGAVAHRRHAFPVPSSPSSLKAARAVPAEALDESSARCYSRLNLRREFGGLEECEHFTFRGGPGLAGPARAVSAASAARAGWPSRSRSCSA